jgi:hypothetical protein
MPTWRAENGSPIACLEKIKVLDENFAELRQIAVDTLDDGVLLGCTEAQLRQSMHDMIEGLVCSFSDSPTRTELPSPRP